MLQVLFLRTKIWLQRRADSARLQTDDLRKTITGEDVTIHEGDNLLLLSTPRSKLAASFFQRALVV